MLPLHTPRSVVLLCLLFIPCLSLSAAETWRGLIVADESPCPGYDRKRDYLDTEQAVTARQGPRSLYTGRIFDDLRDSQVDHIVAIARRTRAACARPTGSSATDSPTTWTT